MKRTREQVAEGETRHGDGVEVLTQRRSGEPTANDQQLKQEPGERKRAEKERPASETLLRKIVDAIPVEMMVIDRGYRIVLANLKAREAAGGEDPAAKRLACYQVSHRLQGPCEGLAGPCPLREVVATKAPVTVTHTHYDADGNEKIVEVSAAPVFDEAGEVVQIIESCCDITDRKRAEEQLHESGQRHRDLIESVPVGLFRKAPGLEGKFLLANQALVEMLGYESHDAFLQANMVDLTERPDDWRGLYDELTVRGPVIAKEMLLKKKDGSPLWGAVTVSVVRNELGEAQYINGLIEDITERKLLETQLAQAQKLEAMGQLAAGIAHEINTPIQYVGDNTQFTQEAFADLMALVRRYEELLAEANVPPELQARFKGAADEADLGYLSKEIPAAIQQSLEGVGRVTEIVRAMKEFAHPDTAEKVPTDINKAIESTVALARNEWKYVAEVQMALDPEMPMVPVLGGDFKQVILNLLINAAHAIGDAVEGKSDGKGQITVSTRRDGDWAELRVGDTGTGMPEEIRGKVFDLFFTTKETGKGTGQGLAIARAVVVEKHGGTIDFETEVGKGTTFIIRIPVDPDASSPEGSES